MDSRSTATFTNSNLENQMDIQNLFKLGMKRDIAQLIEPDHRRAVNLGAGNSPIPGVESLDWPNWDGASGRVPYEDGELTAVYAFHFFEHLTGAQVIDLVKDLQRAMAVGATLNVVVPFYNSNIAHQDLDHKTFFTEETWRTLFRNPFYDKNREDPWKFIIGTNVIIGVAERNLAVMSQLIRVA
ncbi:methyltransferase [Pseudomonas phage APTC-PA18]|nr:methyltransferase [Pseudomonas phage APTC-PA18]